MPRYISDFEKKIVTLAIDNPSISDELVAKAQKEGFHLKKEFHITVLYSWAFEKMGEGGFRQFVSKVEKLSPPTYKFDDKVYYITKNKTIDGVNYPRESLVVPVNSPDIHANLAYASKGLVQIDAFLHTTLFTRQDNKHARIGIGIISTQDWHDMKPKLYFENWEQS